MPRQSPLHTAAESGDVAAVQAELAKGEGTEVLNDGFNETPLHRAAVKGQINTALELLRAGASLTAKRTGGFTPLHMSETVEMAKMLLDHGADRTVKANVRPAPAPGRAPPGGSARPCPIPAIDKPFLCFAERKAARPARGGRCES